MRLISEWVAEAFPADRVLFQVRVGVIQVAPGLGPLTREERRMIGLTRRMVDAIVLRPKEVILIEAGIRSSPSKLGQLLVYREAFEHTEEFEEERGKPIRLVLLSALEDVFLRGVAERAGVQFEVFSPQWALDYLDSLEGRKRVPSQASF